MKWGATIAQTLWLATNLSASVGFARALGDPKSAQTAWLRGVLRRDRTSRFGRQHEFARIADYRGFSRHVPVMQYRDVEPWIQQIRGGEENVLSVAPVSHLVPTSGTSGARKLIPFTEALQKSFSTAVGAWITDLARARPGLVLGPSYWAISPLADATNQVEEHSFVPIGFVDDADYLSPLSAWLLRQSLAVPSSVRQIEAMETWKAVTLLCLLRQRDLRLISIWHPSYLEVLAADAPKLWPKLCDAIRSGDDPWLGQHRVAPDPGRARELARIGPTETANWWPKLQVISCWGEQAAEPGWRQLRGRYPNVLVQAKGLLATEAVVTLPWREQTPLAVTSHFFEFMDEKGDVVRAHELREDRSYEVIVTNGGGLWRYRLGDRVVCTGFVEKTPSLRFLGRSGNVSDLRGEKLSETFVAAVLADLWAKTDRPVVGELHARTQQTEAGEQAWYELHTSGPGSVDLAERLDVALARNPHYAWARRLGQLGPVKINDCAVHQKAGAHAGLADVKPRVLVRQTADVG